MLVVNLTN